MHPRGSSEAASNILVIMVASCVAFISVNGGRNCMNGVMEKGVCVCHQGYFGPSCDVSFTEACTSPNATVPCSGRGDCVDGACMCHSRRTRQPDIRYSGRFCECDDYNCPFFQGRICGGPSRGKCLCGKCTCANGFKGDKCECSTSTRTCLHESGSICNNNGDCVCGRCKCDPNSPFVGPKCDVRKSEECSKLRKCVLCRVFEEGMSHDECSNHKRCSNLRIHSVDQLKGGDDFYRCDFREKDNCTLRFLYKYDDMNRLFVQAMTRKVCPEEKIQELEIPAADSPYSKASIDDDKNIASRHSFPLPVVLICVVLTFFFKFPSL